MPVKKVRKRTTRRPGDNSARKKAAAKRPSAKRAGGTRETEARTRARKALAGLKKLYPEADCALRHRNAFELLVATILSAQSTDANVNRVTPRLFRRFPTPAALARAETSEIEKEIHSTGFFRQKTRSIQGSSQRLVDDFDGEVPDTMKDLLTLPGVARKTANVILGTWFKKSEGVVVDTHVGRLAHRLGLTWSSKDTKDAVRIEQDLVQVLPRKEWTFFSHAMILHGRQVCSARKPVCEECALAGHCPSAGQ